MNTRPTFDYYAILDVPKSATAEQIKQAYRDRAKDLHPDRNKKQDATAQFQLLQEAYSVLGSMERRMLYDQGNFAAAVDPATPATEVIFEPVNCDACGKVSAQIRFLEYETVLSMLIASFSQKRAGTFCPRCASLRLFTSSLITGAFGWLGVRGAFWSLRTIFNNSLGGERKPGINTFLMGKQAAYFYQQGNADLANALAHEAIALFPSTFPSDADYSLGKQGLEMAKMIASSSKNKVRRLKSEWSGWPLAGRFALIGFAIPLGLWWLLFTGGLKSDPVQTVRSVPEVARAAPQGVFIPDPQGVFIPDPGPQGVSSPDAPQTPKPLQPRMVGADGHTYTVSNFDYARLKPVHDGLTQRGELLKSKVAYRDAWRQRLEAFRAQNQSMTEEQAATYNTEIELFNSSLDPNKVEAASFDREVSAYNAELKRVGRRID